MVFIEASLVAGTGPGLELVSQDILGTFPEPRIALGTKGSKKIELEQRGSAMSYMNLMAMNLMAIGRSEGSADTQ